MRLVLVAFAYICLSSVFATFEDVDYDDYLNGEEPDLSYLYDDMSAGNDNPLSGNLRHNVPWYIAFAEEPRYNLPKSFELELNKLRAEALEEYENFNCSGKPVGSRHPHPVLCDRYKECGQKCKDLNFWQKCWATVQETVCLKERVFVIEADNCVYVQDPDVCDDRMYPPERLQEHEFDLPYTRVSANHPQYRALKEDANFKFTPWFSDSICEDKREEELFVPNDKPIPFNCEHFIRCDKGYPQIKKCPEGEVFEPFPFFLHRQCLPKNSSQFFRYDCVFRQVTNFASLIEHGIADYNNRTNSSIPGPDVILEKALRENVTTLEEAAEFADRYNFGFGWAIDYVNFLKKKDEPESNDEAFTTESPPDIENDRRLLKIFETTPPPFDIVADFTRIEEEEAAQRHATTEDPTNIGENNSTSTPE